MARSPGRPPGARTKAPEERAAELVDAAIAAIHRCGPDATMASIAAEAGITKAVLYDHFPGREGLRRAVVERYGRALNDRLAAGLGTQRTPQQVLQASVETFVRHIEADRDLFLFVNQGSSLFVDAVPVFEALIAGTLDAAGADTSGSRTYALAALGAVFAATEAWAADPRTPRAVFVEQLCAVLWQGLAGVGLAVDAVVDMAPAVTAMVEDT